MIYIDDRKGSIELAKQLNMPCEVTRLDFGDACFMGFGPEGQIYRIAIERKRIDDMVSSMDSGRLAGHQLIGLLNEYHEIWLLIEGLWKPDDDGVITWMTGGGWRRMEWGQRKYLYHEVSNFCASLSAIAGMHVWRTSTLKESGLWIRNLYHWWQKPWEQHKSLLAYHKAAPPPKKSRARFEYPGIVERVAKELKTVGWARATELAKKFESVQQLCIASVEDLKQVEGIGPKMAESIYRELRGEKT